MQRVIFFSSLPRFPIMFVYFDLTLKNVVEIVNVLIVYGFLKKELLRQHQCALIIMELICKSDNLGPCQPFEKFQKPY